MVKVLYVTKNLLFMDILYRFERHAQASMTVFT